MRFLHNIIRFPGCGLFDAQGSRVIEHLETGAVHGILLCSRVRLDVGHITQACVIHFARGLGLGTLMLRSSAQELAQRGFSRLSLTVTEGNRSAAALYRRLGFVDQHSFDAMVWTRPPHRPRV
jgi:ribosomal protein S18 acetylase RimI-like enzyme